MDTYSEVENFIERYKIIHNYNKFGIFEKKKIINDGVKECVIRLMLDRMGLKYNDIDELDRGDLEDFDVCELVSSFCDLETRINGYDSAEDIVSSLIYCYLDNCKNLQFGTKTCWYQTLSDGDVPTELGFDNDGNWTSITTSLSPDIVDMFRVVNKTFNEKVVIDSRHQKLKMIRGDKKYGI